MMRQDLSCGAAMLAFACLLVACSPKNVSYRGEVRPIFDKYCVECHAPGKEGFEKTGFDVSSYETLIKGGKFGPLVKPGDAFTSALNMLVEGRAHPSIRMPHGREKLSERETETLKAWVNEGAKNN
jgi:mono/diheme cytochrome c family protein